MEMTANVVTSKASVLAPAFSLCRRDIKLITKHFPEESCFLRGKSMFALCSEALNKFLLRTIWSHEQPPAPSQKHPLP